MNIRIFLLCASLLAIVPFANAKPDKDDSSYTDAKVEEVNERIDSLEKKLEELEKTVTQQTKEIAGLDNWAREKWDIGVEELAKANQTADDGNVKGSLALWILIPIGTIVLLFVGFLFLPGIRKSSPPVDASSGARPKCPRCGWEHAPGATVCKNPACKTQF